MMDSSVNYPLITVCTILFVILFAGVLLLFFYQRRTNKAFEQQLKNLQDKVEST